MYLFQTFNDGRTPNIHLGLTRHLNKIIHEANVITTSSVDAIAHTKFNNPLQFVIYFVAYSGISFQKHKVIKKLDKKF